MNLENENDHYVAIADPSHFKFIKSAQESCEQASIFGYY